MGKEKKDAQIEIGQSLVKIKIEKEVTNYVISNETGLSRGQIKSIMEGTGNPTIKTVDRVCKFLDCEIKIERK